MWVYGSGFPKSLNVGKQDGCEAWDGWGTALKPAHEPIVLARKPLDGTVANNVLTYGVGGINIDGCRVGADGGGTNCNNRNEHGRCLGHNNAGRSTSGETVHGVESGALGRFPANFIHDGSDEVLELFPQVKTGTIKPHQQNSESDSFGLKGKFITGSHTGDGGSAARFFYCAKASKKDRNEGLDGFEEKRPDERSVTGMGTFEEKGVAKQANHHPTVKPTDLMRYLCRLVTPPNGVVLDPFTGSGSTGKAAVLEGFSFIGVEQSEEYIKIAQARIESANK
jgi:site-specific DNA-methyltransferase (adenine-specific)